MMLPLMATLYDLRFEDAGPSVTTPVLLKVDPWLGQMKMPWDEL